MPRLRAFKLVGFDYLSSPFHIFNVKVFLKKRYSLFEFFQLIRPLLCVKCVNRHKLIKYLLFSVCKPEFICWFLLSSVNCRKVASTDSNSGGYLS